MLRDFVPFIQFKKREKSRGGVLFLEINTFPWVFFMFLKWYKWYQRVQSISYVVLSFKCDFDLRCYIPSQYLLVPSHQQKHQNNV